jgi:hypothetical protein
MSELRGELRQCFKEGKVNKAIEIIDSLYEKATAFDSLTEGLMGEVECPKPEYHWTYNPLTPYGETKAICPLCGYNGYYGKGGNTNGKILRPLTLEEKMELFEYQTAKNKAPLLLRCADAVYLKSGIRVVREGINWMR